MMRDRIERVCSSNWDVTAALAAKDQNMKLGIEKNAIDASDLAFFKEEPPITRLNAEEAFKVKILLNFAPQQGYASSMQPIDTSALVSILRNISREPKIGRFSIVVFNMNEQRVVYRQQDADHIDFPELGKALSTLKLGMIDYKKLADPHSGSDFLSKLVLDELGNNKTDAVIFAGPEDRAGRHRSGREPERAGERSLPCFLHELQPDTRPKSVAGPDRECSQALTGLRVHHHQTPRFVDILV